MRRTPRFPSSFVRWTSLCVLGLILFVGVLGLWLRPSEASFSGYTYRRSITVDHSKIANTDQTNFPLLISGTYSYLATTGNGGNVQNSSGYDVIFTSDSSCAAKLDHEVETYNATTGEVNYWVKVPSLSHATDTVFYMCYGKPGVRTDPSNKTAVWDTNYKAVWHVPNGSTLNVTDSTTNHDLTNNSATATTGKADGGVNFDGSSQYLSSAQHTDFNWANLRTVEFWMKLGSTTQTSPRLFSHGDGSSDGWNITWVDPPSVTPFYAGNFLVVSIGTQSTPSIQKRTPDNAYFNSTNAWHHVAVIGDGTTATAIYVDGNAVTASDYTGNITNTTVSSLDIGRRNNNGRYFNGSLDEIRFSNVQRSADWIKTQYNNQSSPATFYSIGGSYTYGRRITIDHTKVGNTDQANFPLLISGTYSYLATVANGGTLQNANGYDVIFTADAGCATKLDHEVETYNATNGAVNYWVRVPTLSHTSDTVFYMCYGNSSISTSQENAPGVWDSNFRAVYHLKDGSTLNVTDSTTNHDLTNNSATATTGKADGGVNFDGSSQYLSSAQHTDFNWANLRTVEFWMKLGSTTQTSPRLFSHGDGSSDGWNITWVDPPSVTPFYAGNFLVVSIGTQSTPSIQKRTPDNAYFNSTNAWHHVAVIGDGTTATAIYVDGNAVTASDYTGNITNTTVSSLDIGRRNNNGRYFNGSLDEIRFSNAQRSADWIKTQYNNQSSPATFYHTCPNIDDCNQAPTANAGGPYSGLSQIPILMNGSGSSDSDGTIANYAWNFGDGTSGNAADVSHTYSLPGTYTISLTITDNGGATASASTTAVVTNQPPISNVGGPYSGVAQQPIQFNGSGSTDSDGTIASYLWSFSDGATATDIAPVHTYQSPGSYFVTLTVTDNQGATNSSSVFANVTSASNQPPVANIGGPYSPVTGTAIQFNGSGSSDPDGTITQYQWNFADGTASGASPTHIFAAPGSHLVTLTITDNGGATTSKSIDVNVGQSGGGTGPESDNDVNWDPSNRPSLDDPRNRRGTAPNTTTGNNNFQIVAPVLSLPGRGLELNLNLTYNSLVWNKSAGEILFDIDHDSPAPGWQLGFGKMVAMGTAGAMIIEPDGTRHSFNGTVFNYTYPNLPGSVVTFKGQTTDGSLIEYRCEMGTFPQGVARYPNGTVVSYGNYSTDSTHMHNYAYPYLITDANGNSIAIRYVQPWDQAEPRIERIIDSVGRVITFHYDSSKRLTSITAPGLSDENGATTQTFVRLHYKTQSLNLAGAFTGLITRAKSADFSALDAIYYPATGKGYWFGANDSYSSYGMIRKVSEERGMSFSPGANSDEQGTISEGPVTKQQIYDYPTAPAGLSAAPSFTNLTDSWAAGPSTAPVTQFSIEESPSANERTITITNPDGSKTVQKSFSLSNLSSSDPNKFKDGLMKEQQTLDSIGNLLLKTIFTWEKGADDAPRLQSSESIDELNQSLITRYDQYGPNNSIGRTREYDYDGATVLRSLRNTYVSYLDNDLDQGIDPSFGIRVIHPRRVNMVDSAKVFSGDDSANNLASQTDFKYDEYSQPLKSYASDCDANLDLFIDGYLHHNNGSAVGIVSHAANFNPLPPGCHGGSGSEYITKRGNVTSVVRYADTSNSSSPGSPITETRAFDMAGNVIAASLTCCEQISSVFELATQYGFAVSQTRGSADPSSLLRVTTSGTFDLKTGLPLTNVDANGRHTNITYFDVSLRPKEVILASGARTTFEYDDVAMKVTQTTRLTANGTIAGKSTKYLNGAGQIIKEEGLGTNNVTDIVDTVYDQFGRLSKQSRPHRSGETPQFTETIYDEGGRILEQRAPYADAQDLELNGTITRYFYNETSRPNGASSEPGQTTRIVDPWGRSRWSRSNASGKLAEVVEPHPTSPNSSGYATKYYYDAANNLVRVEQGDQVRRFGYDSLGRLTQQKSAEANATLNRAGEKVSDTEMWSDVFTYDQRSNMTSHTDARGVKTVLSYQLATNQEDPLNRLQSVSYDTSRVDTSLTVLPAPAVTIQYRTKPITSSLVDVTQVEHVVASGVSTEDFDYDTDGRLQEKRVTLSGRSQPMTITYNYDNLSRVAQVTYPQQYQSSGSPIRKVVTPSYDVAGRMDGLQVNGVNYASQIDYNADSQITSVAIGAGASQLSETYQFDSKSGLLTNQRVFRNGTMLKGLDYGYRKDAPCPQGQTCPDVYHSTAYTGQVTTVTEAEKYNFYSYDALGRLQHVDQWAKTSPAVYTQKWTQDYSYDRFGNRTGTASTGNSGGVAVPRDGYQSLSYDLTSNRITSTGFSYDPAGNQLTNGTGQSLIYDAAGRLASVKDQNNVTVATYSYGASNHRLITQSGNESSPTKTYYVWEGDSVITEYTDPSGAAMPQWSKNYIYFGSRLLATEEPNGAGGEVVHYHHPDRLGTRLVTNNADTTFFEQATLPFGIALDSESSGTTNRRFTSYDRSASTGLDYAVNRQYDSKQGRFTQPDQLGLGAASLVDPQSLNMYSYVGNDPMNRIDSDGQFWGALIQLIAGLFHNLKPNIINGSFAYHNHAPVSVSFTTNFQNIGVGYGAFGIRLRAGSNWLPDVLSASQKKKDPPSLFSIERFRWCLQNKFSVDFYNDPQEQYPAFDNDRTRGYFNGQWGDRIFSVGTNMIAVDSSYIRGLRGTHKRPGGYTDPSHPENNFIASDVAKTYPFEVVRAAWVHELGNSIAHILSRFTGKDMTIKAKNQNIRDWDGDSGMALEECVYGGAVGSDAQGNVFVTTNPEGR